MTKNAEYCSVTSGNCFSAHAVDTTGCPSLGTTQGLEKPKATPRCRTVPCDSWEDFWGTVQAGTTSVHFQLKRLFPMLGPHLGALFMNQQSTQISENRELFFDSSNILNSLFFLGGMKDVQCNKPACFLFPERPQSTV